MSPPRSRFTTNHRKSIPPVFKYPLEPKARLACLPLRMHRLLYPNLALLELSLPSNRLRHTNLFPIWPTTDNRLITLFNFSPPHHLTQFPRHRRTLRHEDTTTRFPIQSIHKKELHSRYRLFQNSQQSHLVTLPRRVHDQGRWFVHDKPILALLEDRKIRSCRDS